MKEQIATIFGGTGFVGRQIVRELALRGVIVKVATRIPEAAYFLKPMGSVGQIVPVRCDYSDQAAVAALVKGSDIVINCIGILYEKGKSMFQHAHVDVPVIIASASAKAGVKRLVHISALGIESNTSKYAKTKLEGEKALLSNFPDATILRPSVIFGEDDNFFNMFAKMAGVLPALPLIGGGKTKFQPVYVGDVADAVVAALETPKSCGQIYQLGGPEILDFKAVYERLFEYTHNPRPLIGLPFALAKIQAAFMCVLPKPLLTPDQVESLKHDNVVDETAQGLRDLGVTPTGLDAVLPLYLERYREGGRFADIQTL